MNILEQIAQYAYERVKSDTSFVGPDEIKQLAFQKRDANSHEYAFEKALKKQRLSFICECKKASPSKGLIDPLFDYMSIAREYEQAGADCVSVLTEPKWFLGDDRYLQEIAENISIPCLRKDFVVDEYQIYQAKVLGAEAVLLICSLLKEEKLKEYIHICDTLRMSALVEIHDEYEAQMAIRAGARIVGVNNRNLKDFSVNVQNCKALREKIPDDILYVSESGLRTAEDIRVMKDIGADAVLVGEALMRATNKKDKLREFIREA